MKQEQINTQIQYWREKHKKGVITTLELYIQLLEFSAGLRNEAPKDLEELHRVIRDLTENIEYHYSIGVTTANAVKDVDKLSNIKNLFKNLDDNDKKELYHCCIEWNTFKQEEIAKKLRLPDRVKDDIMLTILGQTDKNLATNDKLRFIKKLREYYPNLSLHAAKTAVELYWTNIYK